MRTGRLWTYVRTMRPRRTGGSGSPVLLLARSPRGASRDAFGRLQRIMQADAYAGFNGSTCRAQAWPNHRGGVLGAWSAQVLRAGNCRRLRSRSRPCGRIDELFAIERQINGFSPERRSRSSS